MKGYIRTLGACSSLVILPALFLNASSFDRTSYEISRGTGRESIEEYHPFKPFRPGDPNSELNAAMGNILGAPGKRAAICWHDYFG